MASETMAFVSSAAAFVVRPSTSTPSVDVGRSMINSRDTASKSLFQVSKPARTFSLEKTFAGLSVSGSSSSNFFGSSSTATSPALFQTAFEDAVSPIEMQNHGKRFNKLNKPADQRKALKRGLVTELLRHGQIKCTMARAKAIRGDADNIIQLAKDGSLHARRQALGYVYDKQLVHAVFEKAPKRYTERNGGYTRVLRTWPRKGDNAPMAIIELV